MAADQEVSSILAEAEGGSFLRAKEQVDLAVKEVTRLLAATNESLVVICETIENASSREELSHAFKRFNGVTRILLEATTGADFDQAMLEAVRSFVMSPRLGNFLAGATSLRNGLRSYKSAIIQELAVAIRGRERSRHEDEADEKLFTQFLGAKSRAVDPVLAEAVVTEPTLSLKRGFSALADVIPRKSKIPALVSLARATEDLADICTYKKKILLTREKLRAGMHDERGLLNLTTPTSSSLERSKKLELLKSAGVFDSKNKYNFEDKVKAAALRLELGLGGHSVADSLLFGQKVLSEPGSLTTKNISDIQNNITSGNTTWRHQNAYAKMIIAGCIHQARRIFERFDSVLYGPAPESLIEKAHSSISELLDSEDCRDFVDAAGDSAASSVAKRDLFVKRVVQAVSPILPISLRNKSLDGGYFRTALHLLGSAEFLFAQYEKDIRTQANPAGLVGMSSAMHADLKNSAFYGEELKPVAEFVREMKSQYQASLGLGAQFAKDSGSRTKKRARQSRGRSFFQGRRLPNQGVSRFQAQEGSFGAPNQGGGYATSGFSNVGSRGLYHGRGSQTRNAMSTMSRDECFDFRAGNCRRGASCRFHHAMQ